ncbi:F-box protein At3g07870-like [Diospyros lotus]|uniref:F-box protein At3g07870-like n=1 Tax=Diospyros lotus TaxID=55363 RepID=UPI00225AC1E2|nr:F-box protein At3g07870-like [Diospyros lotus]
MEAQFTGDFAAQDLPSSTVVVNILSRFQPRPGMLNSVLDIPSDVSELLGSCNCLLCLLNGSSLDSICICNPSLGESIALEEPSRDKDVQRVGYWIGFCPATGKSKVIRVVNERVRKSEVEACILGSETWRHLGDSNFLIFGEPGSGNFSGALNWVGNDCGNSELVCSFGIGQEQSLPIPWPSEMTLGVLGTCICIFDNSYHGLVDIWTLNGYGVAGSWTKGHFTETSGSSRLRRLKTLWGNGEILISCCYGGLVSYDPKGKNSTRIKLYGLQQPGSEIGAYIPRSISLKDAVVGEQSRIAKIRSKRLRTTSICSSIIREEVKSKRWKRFEARTRVVTPNTGVSMLDLPTPILTDILSRLPIKTIFNCMQVSKIWRNLLADPYFARCYLSRSPTTGVLLSINATVHLLELGQDYSCNDKLNKPMSFNSKYNLPSKQLYLVGSCNGLVCLLDRSSPDSVYISNPVLGESIILPKPKREKNVVRVAYAFGFSPVTGEYKVIRFTNKKVHGHLDAGTYRKSEVEVCTLGSSTWRYVGDAPFCEMQASANLNGSLHWLDDSHDSEFICSFDIGEEKFRQIPLPPQIGSKTCWLTLGILGNRLSIFDNYYHGHVDMWSLKDYGIAGSWTKDYVVQTSGSSRLPDCVFRPVTLWGDGEILISCRYGLFSYDPKQNDSTKIKVYGNQLGSTAASYIPNCISLKDIIVRGERTSTVNIRSA